MSENFEIIYGKNSLIEALNSENREINKILISKNIHTDNKIEQINLSNLTSIGNYAFYMGYGKKFTIPSTITTIGNYAFYNTKVEKIINKTGRSFDWKEILNASSCSSEGEFVTGTCTSGDRTTNIIGG